MRALEETGLWRQMDTGSFDGFVRRQVHGVTSKAYRKWVAEAAEYQLVDSAIMERCELLEKGDWERALVGTPWKAPEDPVVCLAKQAIAFYAGAAK